MEDALTWASVNGYRADDYDVTDTYVRVHPHGRSKKPRRAQTIPFSAGGVKAVIAW
jgi:hypothetical protein